MKKYALAFFIATLVSSISFAQQTTEDKPKKEHREHDHADDNGKHKGWDKKESQEMTKEQRKKMKEAKKQMEKEQKARDKERKRREKETRKQEKETSREQSHLNRTHR